MGSDQSGASQEIILQPSAPPATDLPGSRLEQVMSTRAGVKLKQFGYDQFGFGRPVSIPQMGAVQDDYILGPGDEIDVSLRGQQNAEYQVTVARDGRVILPLLNPVSAAGRPFGEFRRDLLSAISRAYLSTKAFVSISRLREISVLVTGEINNPGARIMTGLSTAADAILISGGVRKTGSLRAVRIVRGGRSISVDLYNLVTQRGNGRNVHLADGDRIIVPPLGRTVAVAGWVRLPGIFELPPGASSISVRSLSALAGGFEIRGKYRLSVLRQQADGQSRLTKVDERGQVRDGEILSVELAAEQVTNQAELAGGVTLAGRYAITDGMRLSELIRQPGADWKFSRHDLRRHFPAGCEFLYPPPHCFHARCSAEGRRRHAVADRRCRTGVFDGRSADVARLDEAFSSVQGACPKCGERSSGCADSAANKRGFASVRLGIPAPTWILASGDGHQSAHLEMPRAGIFPPGSVPALLPSQTMAGPNGTSSGAYPAQAYPNGTGAGGIYPSASYTNGHDQPYPNGASNYSSTGGGGSANPAATYQAMPYQGAPNAGTTNFPPGYPGAPGYPGYSGGSNGTPISPLAALQNMQNGIMAMPGAPSPNVPQGVLSNVPPGNLEEQNISGSQVPTNEEAVTFVQAARQLSVEPAIFANFLLDHSVVLSGAVRGPGLYFAGPSLTLDTLIDAAGGASSWADGSAIDVISTSLNQRTGTAATAHGNIQIEQVARYVVRPHDEFHVHEIYSDANFGSVTLQGEVEIGRRLSDNARRTPFSASGASGWPDRYRLSVRHDLPAPFRGEHRGARLSARGGRGAKPAHRRNDAGDHERHEPACAERF